MAKVTDFGIARSLDEDGLTADGRVLGTTDYVSPEQALGHAVNGQSDIYSLGIVLYEMLAGDVPFHGENQVAVAMKHVREDIPDIVAHAPRGDRQRRRRARPHDLPSRSTRRYAGHRHARGRPRGRARARGRPPAAAPPARRPPSCAPCPPRAPQRPAAACAPAAR